MLSVIIPLYNASSTISETLQSVLASSYTDIEVVVCDDGSTDNGPAIVEAYAEADSRVRLVRQTNKGVSAARNTAILHAQGEWILPVDADDKISPTYIEHAMAHISDEVRIIGCRAMFFGEKNGEWRLPDYSPELLARKNMIHISSLFRKSDWARVGGFCEEDIYREDWDFWLSLLEQGGTYLRLNEIGLYYRVQSRSRRITAKRQKRAIVDAINARHPEYMQRYLGGPLHYHRSWSKWINKGRRVYSMYEGIMYDVRRIENRAENKYTLYEGRNTLIAYGDVVVKYFAVPMWWRKVLSILTSSKAKRSYLNAMRLNDMPTEKMHGSQSNDIWRKGKLTPEPLGYAEERYFGLLCHSSYTCRKSHCPYSLQDIVYNRLVLTTEQEHQVYQAVGRFVAELHRRGCLHRDLSPGNLLFTLDGSEVQVVDLNRIRWCRHISRDTGLRNFERLNLSGEALTLIAHAYADTMGYDRDYSERYILSHRWWKHRM